MTTEQKTKFYIILVLILILTFSGVFVFFVYKPFFWITFISLILYLGSRDYYLRIKKFLNPKFELFAPWIMISLLVITVLLPLALISTTLISEFLSLLFIVKVNVKDDKLIPFLLSLPWITDYFTDTEFFWVQFPAMYREIVNSYGDILNFDNLFGILSNATSLILGGLKVPLEITVNVIFSFILLFFFYKDGHKIEKFLIEQLPLSEEIKVKIGYRVLDAVKAVFKGNLLISLLQGFVLGIILWILQIPNPVLYGSIGAFFSLIPIIGTAVVWLPAGLYLGLIEGKWINAIFLMSFAFGSYLILENFVKPYLLDKKLNLHPFLLFLALLGGIKEFGIIGLVIGPVAVTIIVILWDFWKDFREYRKSYGPS
ncbi:MAG: AI-2E family transporter [Leptospiraceae bacterium]|nr:AI-2E family transporter [Leptospiraceae bacterium]